MINILSSDSFTGQLPAPDSTGLSPIFRGKVSTESESVRCYIKPLPDSIISPSGQLVENREILSEALGYTLAKGAGLQTPDNAGIIVLKAEQIPSRVVDHLKSITPGNEVQSDYACWFSQDMLHPSLLKNHIPDGHPSIRLAALSRLAVTLSKNDQTPTIITFDEWTENSDRNLGNLLGTAAGEMTLIDHGRLFRYPTWSPKNLEASPYGLKNVISDLINNFIPHWSEKTPIKSARLLAYNNLSACWKSGSQSAAEKVLAEFLDTNDVKSVLEFLSGRLEQSTYNTAVGLLV